MTKADIVAKIADKLGLEKTDVQSTVETFMEEVKNSYTSIKIPAHNIPAFKPAKVFTEGVKTNVEVEK